VESAPPLTGRDVSPVYRVDLHRLLNEAVEEFDMTIGIQQFKNDRSLSDAQVDTILRWVEAGAPKGDPKDLPPARQWPDDSVWQLADKFGPPDLIIKSSAYTMPAVAQDAW
jgi:hypothetical protein